MDIVQKTSKRVSKLTNLRRIKCLVVTVEQVITRLETVRMLDAVRNAGKSGHNAQTCPEVRRCRTCNGRGHDTRNCPMAK